MKYKSLQVKQTVCSVRYYFKLLTFPVVVLLCEGIFTKRPCKMINKLLKESVSTKVPRVTLIFQTS